MPAGPVRVRGVPTQTGPLLVAVATGRALTTTVVVTAALLHPLALVTTILYTPAMPRVALADTVGLCVVLVYPNGPVSSTHLRAHETPEHLVCRLLLEKT